MATKTKSVQAQASTMIRKYLKANFAQYKFQVKSSSASMMTALNVYCENINPTHLKQIEEYVALFQYGKFDGMTDSYDYTNCNDDLPQVKYASVSCKYSKDLKDAVEEKHINIATNADTLDHYDRSAIVRRYLQDAENWTGTQLNLMIEETLDLIIMVKK